MRREGFVVVVSFPSASRTPIQWWLCVEEREESVCGARYGNHREGKDVEMYLHSTAESGYSGKTGISGFCCCVHMELCLCAFKVILSREKENVCIDF